MRCTYNILFILFFVASLSGQNYKGDSLHHVFRDTEQIDSVRFEAGYSAFMTMMRLDLDSARITGHELLKFSIEKNNKNWESTSNKLIGNTYAIQGRFENANEYFFRSHHILRDIDDKKGLATILNNIGTVFYELGNYTHAQDYLLKSLRLTEELNDDNATARTLNNLGNVHNDLRNNEKALTYYEKSLKIKERLGQKRRLPAAYNNIGLIYSNLRKHGLAIHNLNKSAEISKEIGDERSFSRALSNLGIEYSKQFQLDKALDYFNRSIVIKSEINDKDGLASAYLYRGQNYLEMKHYQKAKSDCMSSLEMTKKSGALNLQKEACECISASFEALGDFKSALSYNQRFLKLKDSLFNKERTQEITRNDMAYQFEKQQLADSIAYHKRETAQKVAFEQDINKQHRKFYITLIVSLLIIGFLLFIYAKHKQRLKFKSLENELLNSEIEYKKKDLTNMAVNISNNQEWAESLAEHLEILKASTGRKRANELERLEKEIKNKIWVNNNSDDFYKQIDELSSSFYDKLTSQFDGLTKTDIRLCSLIKLNLNTKQIAILQNINPSSVKMSRNRLRKKLNLSPKQDLSAFLRAF